MQLNFKNKYYFDKAIEVLSSDKINIKLNKEDSFLLLISNLSKEELINLSRLLSKKLNISINSAYNIIQDNNNYKEEIFELAIKLIVNNKYIGEKYDSKYNATSWINHSINVAFATYNLANMIGLDPNYAFIYGLLHDYGRKYVHNFEHVIKGFESLVDLGYENEARACLIHSFINGKRFCLMEIADSNFYLDDNNNEKYKDYSVVDDLTKVLENINYNDYDRILNIADLMATSFGVVSSKDRIKDILTRRNNLEEASNWKYFLVSYYNLLVYVLNKMDNNYNEIDMNLSLEDTKKLLWDISDTFYKLYKEKEKNFVLIKEIN